MTQEKNNLVEKEENGKKYRLFYLNTLKISLLILTELFVKIYQTKNLKEWERQSFFRMHLLH